MCHLCWNKVNFITGTTCYTCGRPILYTLETRYCSAQCIARNSTVQKVFVGCFYDNTIAKVIHDFKYQDQTHYITILAKIVSHIVKRIDNPIDIIVPVPMHKSKLRKKGYNHAALLAKKASKFLNKACEFDILEKKRDTIRQANLSENERRINLTGAFSIHSEQIHKLKNKNILVVDDVITTGATIEECAKNLKMAGAKSIYALAIAKTRGTNIVDATSPTNF